VNLWLRLALLLLRLRRQPPADLLDEITLDLWVLPNDLDAFGHMNNGRYLALMDLGRLAMMARVGLLRCARANDWTPLVRGIEIEYYKPLKLGTRCRLHSRLVSWDTKWVYLEQRFTRGVELHARAHVRGLLRGRDGNIPTAELLAAVGASDRQPPQPPPADVRDPAT